MIYWRQWSVARLDGQQTMGAPLLLSPALAFSPFLPTFPSLLAPWTLFCSIFLTAALSLSFRFRHPPLCNIGPLRNSLTGFFNTEGRNFIPLLDAGGRNFYLVYDCLWIRYTISTADVPLPILWAVAQKRIKNAQKVCELGHSD